MKKCITVCLSLLLIAALLLPFGAMTASAADRTPIINIEGEKKIDVWREDGTHYAPTEEASDPIVEEAVKELIPVFLKALVTNNYDEWSRRALEKLTPIYDDIRPNPDGSLPENSGVAYYPGLYHGGMTDIPAPAAVNYYYSYAWDFRRSPLDEADDLHDFIELVKAKSGSDKVTIVSRCGSTSLAAAYLYKYGTENIDKLIFACSTLPGVPYVDTLLSGNLYISGSALYYRMTYRPLGSFDGHLRTFVNALLYAMMENGSMDDANVIIARAYGKIKDSFVAPFLRSYYAICGNFVATVGDRYDAYRDYIFPTAELKQEYAAILAKTDEYRYNVQAKIGELLTDAEDAGVSVNFIVTYGEPSDYPVSEQSSNTGDELMDVTDQSLGAVTATYPNALPDAYIAEREAAGAGKYISPDKQIDASACLFPETTWFIKNMRHDFFQNDLHDFIRLIAWTDGFTVDADPAYPQFLTVVGDHEGLAPAQAENADDLDPDANKPEMNSAMGFLARVLAFYAKTIAFIAKIFRSLRVN